MSTTPFISLPLFHKCTLVLPASGGKGTPTHVRPLFLLPLKYEVRAVCVRQQPYVL